MIAMPSARSAGYIRGYLPTPILRECLLGNRSFRSALEAGGNARDQRLHYSLVAPGTLVGFVPYPDQPRELIVVRLPFIQRIVPAVLLRAGNEDWEPEPELVSREQLLGYEGVIVEADWLTYLIDLATTLKNPKTHEHGLDKRLLAIGAAWERWEQGDMTWLQRSKDLARLTSLPELQPNTLMQKCKRHGLIRRDK